MQEVIKKLNEIRPVEKNVRKHPRRQIEELIKSVEKYGQYRPLVIDSDGVILIGNGLYEALKEMGAETARCYVLPPDVSEEHKKKLMLSDNRIFMLGQDDLLAIDEIMAELDSFEIPGFDEATLKELYEKVDAEASIIDAYTIPESRRETITETEIRRKEDPSADAVEVDSGKESKYTPVPSTPMAEAEAGSYITCPHCGTKIRIR